MSLEPPASRPPRGDGRTAPPPARPTGATGGPEPNPPTSRGVVAVVCGGIFFSVLNGSIVNVVLPRIGRDLEVDPGWLGWVITAYLLVYGVAIPFYGRLADFFGARRLYLLGLAIFALGSLLCFLAPNFPLLLLARLVQGTGGAAIPGLGMTLASRASAPSRRGAVLGLISTTLGLAAAVGPILGGFVSELFDWNAVFVFGIVAGLLILPGRLILPRQEPRAEGRLDLPGGIFLALAVSGLLLAVTQSASGETAGLATLLLAATALVGFGGLAVRQRQAAMPFIPRELLQNRRYLALVVMSFILMATNLAPIVGLPLLLTGVNELPLSLVGLALLPNAALTAMLGVVAGRVRDRVGGRRPIQAGLSVMLVAILALSSAAGAPVPVMSALLALLGTGTTFVSSPLTATVSLVVRGPLLASAMSINSMFFFVGGSFGSTLLTAVLAARSGATDALNPLHQGAGVAFSDAFLLLVPGVVINLILSTGLPGRGETAEEAGGRG